MGRWYIYQICFNIVNEHFLFGVGPNRFGAVFMTHQSAFLMREIGSGAGQILSKDIFEAFSWPLQLLIEYGAVGVICIVLSVLMLFKKCIIQFGNPWAIASLIGLIVAGFFSNPFHAAPIFILLPIYFGCVCRMIEKPRYVAMSKKSQSVFAVTLSVATCWFIMLQFMAELKWKKAAVKAVYAGFSEAFPLYLDANRHLNTRYEFLYQFGMEAAFAHQYQLAIPLLEAAATRKQNRNVHLMLAEAYHKLSLPVKAIKELQTSIQMIPVAFYPRLQQLKILVECRQWRKAEAIFEILQNFEIHATESEKVMWQMELRNIRQSVYGAAVVN